ncbi:MAG: hypothetical protein HQL32_03150 [Planctomycetes bacterium]|nr:hypothetical protein [Planctomycetota bacterium]
MNQVFQIRGAGVLSCYGSGLQAAVNGINNGECRLNLLNSQLNSSGEDIWVSQLNREDDIDQLGVEVINQALNHCQVRPTESELQKCGLFVGTVSSDSRKVEMEYRQKRLQGEDPAPLCGPSGGRLATRLADSFSLGGPVVTINTACSSSLNALYQAMLYIQEGKIERALVMGIDVLNAMVVFGFRSLMLLSDDGCHPFDAKRAGIQLGESLSAIILEKSNTSQGVSSGDSENIFSGNSFGNADLYLPYCRNTHSHPTALDPEGFEANEVMKAALESVSVSPDNIVAVKAHGTGSREGDASEMIALARLFPDGVPLTSLKRYLGHSMGAAALSELVVYLACLESGFVPKCLGYSQTDISPSIDALYEHFTGIGGYHLLNFFGFGSSLSSLVIKWKG